MTLATTLYFRIRSAGDGHDAVKLFALVCGFMRSKRAGQFANSGFCFFAVWLLIIVLPAGGFALRRGLDYDAIAAGENVEVPEVVEPYVTSGCGMSQPIWPRIGMME